jgi:polyhydroxybutyrate depolymerase
MKTLTFGLAIVLSVLPPALLVALPVPLPVPPKIAAAPKTIVVQYDGEQRTYFLHVPPSPGPMPVRPLLIVLHGGGGTGTSMAAFTGFSSAADTAGVVVAYPTGSFYGGACCYWNDARTSYGGHDDVGFIDAMLVDIRARARIDPSRIFVAGYSNGALMALTLACERPEVFAGVAIVAGSMPDGEYCDATSPRLLIIDGDADHIMPFAGGPVAANMPGGGRVTGALATRDFFARLAGCEPLWTSTYADSNPNDGTALLKWRTAPCHGEAVPTILLQIVRGGHTWPGSVFIPFWVPYLAGKTSQELSATDRIMRFVLE